MPDFSAAGAGKYDFWLLDGKPDFAVIPGGFLNGISYDVPIRLQNGNHGFGLEHIQRKHSHWVNRNEPSGCIPTLLHRKLSQTGKMYLTDRHNYLVAMRMAPEALIVLKPILNQGFFTVVTMYFRQGPIEGHEVGRYLGYSWARSPYVQRG